MVNIEKWRIYIGVIPGPFNENIKFFLIITMFILDVVPNMPVPMVIIPMVAISMSSLAKKENTILVTCITRVFKEIIKIIICFACFYNFVKHLNSYSS